MKLRLLIPLLGAMATAVAVWMAAWWVIHRELPRTHEVMAREYVKDLAVSWSLLAAGIDQALWDNQPLFAARVDQLMSVAQESDIHLMIADAGGIVLYSPFLPEMIGLDSTPLIQAALDGQYLAGEGAESYLVFYGSMPIFHPDQPGHQLGVITIGKPWDASRSDLKVRSEHIWMSAFLASFVGGMGAWLSLRFVLRPVVKLTDYARAVAEGRAARLPPLRNDEVGILGHSIAAMRRELDGKQYIERYVDVLTHSIKGPLGSISGICTAVGPEDASTRFQAALDEVGHEAMRIDGILRQLLLLSRLEGAELSKSKCREFNLVEVWDGVIRQTAADIERKKLNISEEISDDLRIVGDRMLIEHAMLSLFKNALEFTPAGGAIRVFLHELHGVAEFMVEDSGPGIPVESMQRVFDKFYSEPRPDTGRNSSGLGLTLALEIAKQHRGELLLQNCDPVGLRTVLRIPCS